MERGAHLLTPKDPALDSVASARRDAFAIVATLLIVIVLAFLLALPWLPQNNPQIHARNRYQPLAHGQATTRVTLNAEGSPQRWTTENVLSIPALEIFDDSFPLLLQSQLLSILPELAETGRFPADTSLFRSHSRTLDRDGIITESDTYILRQQDRDLVLAVTFPGFELPLLYNPPLDLTTDVESNPTLEQSGSFAGIYTYTFSTAQGKSGDVATPFGNWRDCLQFYS